MVHLTTEGVTSGTKPQAGPEEDGGRRASSMSFIGSYRPNRQDDCLRAQFIYLGFSLNVSLQFGFHFKGLGLCIVGIAAARSAPLEQGMTPPPAVRGGNPEYGRLWSTVLDRRFNIYNKRCALSNGR